MSAALTIDKNKVRQSFAMAANSYDELATLQRKVGLNLLQQMVEDSCCQHVVDVGCGTGFLTQQLVRTSFVEQIYALDIAFSMVEHSRSKLEKADNVRYICADAEILPLQNNSVDLIVSNLALQWCQNLTAVFIGFNKVLKPQSQLMFSTFGPTTLQELKQAWAVVDDYTHVNDFYSADRIDDFLNHAGFKDIKIERQCYQSYYSEVIELMRELKGIGAHNVLSRRNRQTTTKKAMQAMISAYQKHKELQGIAVTYEILFISASSR